MSVSPFLLVRFVNMSRSAKMRFSPASCSQSIRANCRSAFSIRSTASLISATGTFEPSILFVTLLRYSIIIGRPQLFHVYSGVISAVCSQAVSGTCRRLPSMFSYSLFVTLWLIPSKSWISHKINDFFVLICLRIIAPVNVPSKSYFVGR